MFKASIHVFTSLNKKLNTVLCSKRLLAFSSQEAGTKLGPDQLGPDRTGSTRTSPGRIRTDQLGSTRIDKK